MNDRQIPDDIAGYGEAVAASLRSVLGERLIGVYFVGSVALGGYVPGESDVDIAAVVDLAVPDEVKPALASAVFATTPSCPARGLEFTLYRSEIAVRTPRNADFELNVNGGRRMPKHIKLDPGDDSAFWYVLDRAIAHRYGVAIVGPPPAGVFSDVSRRQLLQSMADSMRWHREHEKATLYSVLNACRAWRFAVEDILGSKLEGAAWARPRWHSPHVVDAAVDLRHGEPAALDATEVDLLLAHVEDALNRA